MAWGSSLLSSSGFGRGAWRYRISYPFIVGVIATMTDRQSSVALELQDVLNGLEESTRNADLKSIRGGVRNASAHSPEWLNRSISQMQ